MFCSRAGPSCAPDEPSLRAPGFPEPCQPGDGRPRVGHRGAGGLGRSQAPLSPSGQMLSITSGTKPRTCVRGHCRGLGSEAAAGPV